MGSVFSFRPSFHPIHPQSRSRFDHPSGVGKLVVGVYCRATREAGKFQRDRRNRTTPNAWNIPRTLQNSELTLLELTQTLQGKAATSSDYEAHQHVLVVLEMPSRPWHTCQRTTCGPSRRTKTLHIFCSPETDLRYQPGVGMDAQSFKSTTDTSRTWHACDRQGSQHRVGFGAGENACSDEAY